MKITISKGATINLGNYESARVDIACEVALEEDTEDPILAQREAHEFCKAYLRSEVGAIEKEARIPPKGVSRFSS